ncbi:hypothetical protein D9M72_632080 [compost metagenome]
MGLRGGGLVLVGNDQLVGGDPGATVCGAAGTGCSTSATPGNPVAADPNEAIKTAMIRREDTCLPGAPNIFGILWSGLPPQDAGRENVGAYVSILTTGHLMLIGFNDKQL